MKPTQLLRWLQGNHIIRHSLQRHLSHHLSQVVEGYLRAEVNAVATNAVEAYGWLLETGQDLRPYHSLLSGPLAKADPGLIAIFQLLGPERLPRTLMYGELQHSSVKLWYRTVMGHPSRRNDPPQKSRRPVICRRCGSLELVQTRRPHHNANCVEEYACCRGCHYHAPGWYLCYEQMGTMHFLTARET